MEIFLPHIVWLRQNDHVFKVINYDRICSVLLFETLPGFNEKIFKYKFYNSIMNTEKAPDLWIVLNDSGEGEKIENFNQFKSFLAKTSGFHPL